MAEMSRLHQAPSEADVPEPTDEIKEIKRTPPQLSYGANKKFPHLSKAIEVGGN